MPGSTPVYNLPYLELDDPPDIAGGLQDLAEAVETQLVRIDTTVQPVEAYQAANDTTTSTAYFAGTLHGAAFTAPPSGKVYITAGGALGTNSVVENVGSWMSFEVRAGGTVGSGTVFLSAADSRSTGPWRPNSAAAGYKYAPASLRLLVSGLTPGDTYNVRTLFRSDNAGASAAVHHRQLLVEPVMGA